MTQGRNILALAAWVAVWAAGMTSGCGDDDTGPGEDAASDVTDWDAAVPDAAPEDAEQVDGGTTSGGKPGDPCWVDDDCQDGTCWTAGRHGFPGGYCVVEGCTEGTCPEGSSCFQFTDGVNRCLPTCGDDSDCRQDEGYVCDDHQTCWPGTGTVPPGGSCGTDEQCMGGQNAYCVKQEGFVGGYCIVVGCTTDADCPGGGVCRQVLTNNRSACVGPCGEDGTCRAGYGCIDNQQHTWDGACFPSCATDEDCPGDLGCRPSDTWSGQVCRDVSNECSPENVHGDCPAGQVCHEGTCEDFQCNDTLAEPNDSLDQAADYPTQEGWGYQICSGDEDWYRIQPTSQDKLYLLGVDANPMSGDLNADLTDATGTVLQVGDLAPAKYHEENPVGPTNQQAVALVGSASAPWLYVHVYPVENAVNDYGIIYRLVDWQDGGDCFALFDQGECLSQDTNGNFDPDRLVLFPATHSEDPYLGSGVFFENGLFYLGGPAYTTSGSLWATRELAMIVRYAIHAVQEAFPGTAPLGIGDISMPDGTTPQGHPNGTHYLGSNIDIAYYIREDVQGPYGNMCYRQICCDAPMNDWSCVDTNPNSAGYGTCVAGSENTHIVDIPRTAMLIAKIAGTGRLRVVGVEAKIEADLDAALDDLVTQGLITEAEKNAALAHMATANDHSSWIWHFNHMHFSFLTTPPASNHGRPPRTIQGPWPNLPLDRQAELARTFRPLPLRP